MTLGEISFRRVLLIPLLAVTLPVLIVGVWMTYKKAHSAFLETARQNLTESAIRNAEGITQLVDALQTNLVTATDSVVFKYGNQDEHEIFIKQLAKKLPSHIECIQLTDLETLEITASTCGNESIGNIDSTSWPKEQEQLLTNPDNIYVDLILPQKIDNPNPKINQLELFLSAPVYNSYGKLKYALSFKTSLLQQEKLQPGSLQGYTVVINEQGIILAHRFPRQIGRDIEQLPDAKRMENLIKSAIAGKNNSLHLFFLERNGVELLAGYTAIPSPLTKEQDKKWVILAVAPIASAISPLEQIHQVLVVMIFISIITILIVVISSAHILARPIERIRDYALYTTKDLSAIDQIPQTSRIRECKQLSEALNKMILRVRSSQLELETAWREAETANKLKDEFLATISHELRNPLNKIINPIRFVKDGYCDSEEEANEFLQIGYEQSIHLLAMIDQILDISKIAQGKLLVILQAGDLLEILKKVIKSEKASIQKKGLDFNIPDLTGKIIVYADAERLKQVFDNVVGNAIKFTDTGSITISIEIKNETETEPNTSSVLTTETNKNEASEKLIAQLNSNAQRVVIKVIDTGIGIACEKQSLLFRPFVMVDASTTRKYSGNGLGLAISRKLMELMGGTINLFSEGEGMGTTVEISLPIVESSFIPEIEAEKNPSLNSEVNGNC